MTRPLKTLMTVLFLMTAVSVIRTTIVHFDQKRIVKIIDQTHVVEPLTVTDTTVTDSRLSVSLALVSETLVYSAVADTTKTTSKVNLAFVMT